MRSARRVGTLVSFPVNRRVVMVTAKPRVGDQAAARADPLGGGGSSGSASAFAAGPQWGRAAMWTLVGVGAGRKEVVSSPCCSGGAVPNGAPSVR